MLPFFHRKGLWGYPAFGAVGGAFGYWMTQVERKQVAILSERKKILLEKRARRDQRDQKEDKTMGGLDTVEAAATME